MWKSVPRQNNRDWKLRSKFSAKKLIIAVKQWNSEMEKGLKNKMATEYLSIQRFDHGFSNNFLTRLGSTKATNGRLLAEN